MTNRNTIYLCLAQMSKSGLEQKYIKEAFDTNWVVPLGPNVNGFEKDLEAFASHNGSMNKRVVALSSGTAAVHLSLLDCGVKPGDEVITQSFTFCASAHPITYLGAKPVFVDSEKDSWNMDIDLLEKAIQDRINTTGRKPKAIVPVALYGMPYDIDRILEIANHYEIPVVEDAAEGFGSRWKGRVLGTFGRHGVLSFNGNKIITTSGGGAIICQDDESWKRIMWYATQAREAYPYYHHEAIGYNYRMSNICAGIGRGQMTVADDHLARHRRIQQMYKEAFAHVDGITVHDNPDERYDSNFWLCTILLDEKMHVRDEEHAYEAPITGAMGGIGGVVHGGGSTHTDCEPNINVEAMRKYLEQKKIESRPLWKPMHKQPVYLRGTQTVVHGEGFDRVTTDSSVAYVNGISESLFKRGLCLPSGPCVTDEDVEYIVESIKESIV